MKKLTAELLQEIKTAAQNATPGPWRRAATLFNAVVHGPFSLTKEKVLANAAEKRDAIFIAKANPENVLLLIEAIEQQEPEKEQVTLRQGLERLRQHVEECGGYNFEALQEYRDELKGGDND